MLSQGHYGALILAGQSLQRDAFRRLFADAADTRRWRLHAADYCIYATARHGRDAVNATPSGAPQARGMVGERETRHD